MTFYKPINSKLITKEKITIKTETGHEISFTLIPRVFVDLDAKTDDKKPFFYVTFDHEYIGTINGSKPMTSKAIRKKFIKVNLLTENSVYDHIQLGFVYADDKDPDNHKWMLNFMDVNNNFLFGYNANKVKLNCPFTTVSWEDGVWHGRFVIYKKDVEELTEPEPGYFVLKGSGNIGTHILTPIEKGIESISLRYNIFSNTWYCEYIQNGKIVGTTPCKNIICDVPFIGKVDLSNDKPKVTAELKVKDIKGISIALNALIIKAK